AVDPEQAAGLLVREHVALNRGAREADVLEDGQESGDDRDHADEAVVARGEEPGHDHRREESDDELGRLRPDGERAAADGAASDALAQVVGAEELLAAVRVWRSG